MASNLTADCVTFSQKIIVQLFLSDVKHIRYEVKKIFILSNSFSLICLKLTFFSFEELQNISPNI